MGYLASNIKKLKLPLSFLLIILLFFSFGVFTVRGLFVQDNLTKKIYEHPLVVSNASLIAGLNITKMHRSMKDVVLSNDAVELERALRAVDEGENFVYEQLDIVRDRILGDEGKTIAHEARELFKNWKSIREEVVQLLQAGDRKEAVLITKGKGAAHVGKLEAKMLALTSYARNKADGFIVAAENNLTSFEKIAVILTAAGVLLSVIIASITTYFVVKAEKRIQVEKDNLQKALDEIKTLRGIIPICSHCKQIRDDQGSWKQLEAYIRAHSEAEFSHAICPSCMKTHYQYLFASDDHEN